VCVVFANYGNLYNCCLLLLSHAAFNSIRAMFHRKLDSITFYRAMHVVQSTVLLS